MTRHLTWDPDAVPIVYLDTSIYGRPFDDPAVGANRREIRAVTTIVDAIGNREAALVASFATREECAQATENVRALEEALREQAIRTVEPSPVVAALAARLEAEAGLKPADSRHIACAVDGAADTFLSCNPRRLRKQAAIEAVLGRPFPMMNPPDFVREVLTSHR